MYEREKYSFAMNLVKTEKFYDEFAQHLHTHTHTHTHTHRCIQTLTLMSNQAGTRDFVKIRETPAYRIHSMLGENVGLDYISFARMMQFIINLVITTAF
jgi:hypothetical protein